jgi:hypothetical protein
MGIGYSKGKPLTGRAALALAGTLGLMAVAGPAAAQETRAEVIAQQKAKKAETLRPYVPGRAERIVTSVGRSFVSLPRGVYPAFGSVYPGGGFAVGPAVRVYHGDTSFLEGKALISFREYKRAELTSVWPSLARGRVSLRADVGWLDATQVGYFGRGMQTTTDDGANFRLKETYAGAEARFRPARPLVLGAALAYEDYTISGGRGRRPPIQDRFTPATAPGLDADPQYVHAAATAGIDTRPAAGYTRRGSVLQVDYHNYRDRDDVFSFDRLDATAIQHIPFFRETWVLSMRGVMMTTLNDDDQVPFFLLPALGSGSTLRGYGTGRFRDRHALLLQAEWRWIVNREGMDMAIFYDAGKVAGRRGDLDLDGLRSNIGIGLRIHGPAMTPLRLELARGREGINVVFSGTASF